MKEINLKQILTCDLIGELKKREGVEAHYVEPHESSYEIRIDNEEKEGTIPIRINETGPAIILIVTD